VVDFIFLTGFRKIIDLLLTKLREKGSGWKKILLVGTGQMAKDFIIKIRRHPEWGVKIIGSIDWEENRKGKRYLGIPVVGTLSSLSTILKNSQVDCVVYAVPSKFMDAVQKSVLLCEKMGVTVNMVADYFSHRSSIKRLKDLENKPEICFYSGRNRSFFIFLKSILDKVLALIGILVSSPIMLFTALLIKFTTPGPVLFKQKRCGVNNRRFTFYKFRTMVKNAEVLKKYLLERNEMDGAAFKIKDDPRITGVGKYLRKFSLDELPQLFNVLLGDMSLVGPRPPLPQEVSRYEDWQRRKLSVKPGITCLWQISGRNEIGFNRWMEMDLEYIDNWSLGLDIQILFKTLPAVFLTKGAR
jgi:exopolysaccharide biosynthesis polyprenyl glycosylphosphotransferase